MVKSSIIQTISNVKDFLYIVLFDHLIYNKGRNSGNLLVTVSKDIKLYMIDHSHVFKNQCIWDKACFSNGIKNNDYLDIDIMEYNSYLYKMFFNNLNVDKDKLLNISAEFKQTITHDLLEQIIDNLPLDWVVDLEDVNELKVYICYRLSHLDEIVNMIFEYKKRSWLM